MTKLLITGAKGQLGRAVEKLGRKRGISMAGVDIDTLDITRADAVMAWVAEHRPEALFNCAAFTAVDAAEEREDEATAVNAQAVEHLAAACTRHGVRLFHVSTDYVFNGEGKRPYLEEDPPEPVGAYGRSKYLGEKAAADTPRHLILRTAWLYGLGGNNFVEAICRQVDSGAEKLRVVSDQRGCPTFASDLAEAMLDLLEIPHAQGIFHAVNSGHTSWFGFAQEILRLLGSELPIEPTRSEDNPRPAPRPAFSILDIHRLENTLGRNMPPWQDALRRYMEQRCAG